MWTVDFQVFRRFNSLAFPDDLLADCDAFKMCFIYLADVSKTEHNSAIAEILSLQQNNKMSQKTYTTVPQAYQTLTTLHKSRDVCNAYM